MAIFYDEYLNEGSKEDRLQKKLERFSKKANKAYPKWKEIIDHSLDRDYNGEENPNYDPHYYDNKSKKEIKKDLRAYKKGLKYFKKSEGILDKNDDEYLTVKKPLGVLKQSLKDAKRKSIKEDTFNEACDYIGGCLNEEYSIDIDLLKESCEYVLNVIDEYNEEE